LHSIPKEIQSEKTLTEIIYGGNLGYTGNNFKIGASYSLTKLGFPKFKNDLPYNQFDINGRESNNLGLNYYWHIDRIHLFGEEATNASGGLSFMNGLVFNALSNISLSIMHKHTGKTYQSYNSSPGNSSEDEIYAGTEFYPFQYFKVSAYADTYRWNWLKYRTDKPSTGINYFVQANFTPNQKVTMYLRYAEQNKEENLTIENAAFSAISEIKKKSFRFDISFLASATFSLSNRVELSSYKKEGLANENGFLAYQDVDYSFQKIPMNVNFRYILFDSPYNARIYAYEKDILYGSSTPSYQGKGSRIYIN
jgi:hypothetical protein